MASSPNKDVLERRNCSSFVVVVVVLVVPVVAFLVVLVVVFLVVTVVVFLFVPIVVVAVGVEKQ